MMLLLLPSLDVVRGLENPFCISGGKNICRGTWHSCKGISPCQKTSLFLVKNEEKQVLKLSVKGL